MAAKRAKKAADVEKYIDESGEMMTLSYDQKQKLLMFYGRDTIYSNFRPSPFQLDGVEFNCVEQYFQYQKARKAPPQFLQL